MADPGFSYGGGGGGVQKIMCWHAHYECEALEALGFLMLSCAFWALFLSIPIQNGRQKPPQPIKCFFCWGGGGADAPVAPPSCSATENNDTDLPLKISDFATGQ